jgi:hypothetical protein
MGAERTQPMGCEWHRCHSVGNKEEEACRCAKTPIIYHRKKGRQLDMTFVIFSKTLQFASVVTGRADGRDALLR